MDDSSKTEHYYTRRPQAKHEMGIIRTQLRRRSFSFLTSSSVFSKKRVDLGTKLLIESMILPETGIILDFGCGYGPVGIVAAKMNRKLHIVSVDVNRRAIKLTKENIKLNKVDNIEVHHGFLYEPVKNMIFDVILSNPPMSAGMSIIQKIIQEASDHMKNNGSLQMVVKSKIGGKRLLDEMNQTIGNVKVISRKSGYRVLLSRKS